MPVTLSLVFFSPEQGIRILQEINSNFQFDIYPRGSQVSAAGQANTGMSVHSLKKFRTGSQSRDFLPIAFHLGNLKI